MYSPKYMDYLDEKRIESAFHNPKSKPKTWVGIIPERLKSLENAGLLGYGIAPWQQNDNILDYPRIKSYLISVREVR